jgi:hypothetical protein
VGSIVALRVLLPWHGLGGAEARNAIAALPALAVAVWWQCRSVARKRAQSDERSDAQSQRRP